MKIFSRREPMMQNQGQALIEFALVLPILLTITLGIFDFGRILFTYAMAANSVRDALRHAALEGFVVDEGSDIPAYRNCDFLRDTASQVFFMSDDNITVTYIDGDDVDVRTKCTGSAYDDDLIATGDILEISFYAEITPLTPFVSSVARVIPIQFTGHRTLVKSIDMHGVTDLADPDRDIDFDGLRDLWEDQWFGNNDGVVSTSELAAMDAYDDPDGEGCPNGCEQARGSDPINYTDTDGDGLSDAEEAYTYITDPTKQDTDDDCIPDPDEVNPAYFVAYGVDQTDARVADGDGDGILDGAELGLCAIDVYDDGSYMTVLSDHTDPHSTDTDSDSTGSVSLSDLEELEGFNIPGAGICHTNPANQDTDGDLTPDPYEVMLIGSPGRNPCTAEPTTLRFVDPNLSVAESAGTAHLTVIEEYPVYNPALSHVTTLHYDTAEGSASANVDYQTSSGTLTFNMPLAPTLNQTRAISITLQNDHIDEEDESFSLALSSPTNGNITDGLRTVTITDDEDIPAISILDANALEDDDLIRFEVTLSGPSAFTVTVSYSASDGTAIAGTDYGTSGGGLPGGTVTFAPGTTSAYAEIPLIADTTDELNETFTVSVSNPQPPQRGVLGSATTATGTVQDDDGPPSASIAPSALVDETGQNVSFEVNLAPASSLPITLDYATADDTAEAGFDYDSVSGTLSFPPGVTSQTITVPLRSDALDEVDETFTVNLVQPPASVPVLIGTGTGTVTITDDDDPPTASIQTATTALEDAGSMTFEVTLSAPSGQTITLNYATSDVNATSGADYSSGNGQVSFAPGQTTATISIPLINDPLDEPDESFTVHITLPSPSEPVVLAGTASTGLIQDNDNPPSVSIGGTPISVESEPSTTLSFLVALSAPSAVEVRVGYMTGGGSATPGADYVQTDGTVVFAPGVTQETIVITVWGDSIYEGDETLNVTLLDPATNAILGISSATGTIQDDDTSPNALIETSDSVSEGSNDSLSQQLIYITLEHASETTIQVHYWSTAGSAAQGDYDDVDSVIAFTPGETRIAVYVTIHGDNDDESDESFTLNAQASAQAQPTTKSITIIDDDPTG